MQHCGSPNVEPSQSAPSPDKPVADQPGEPRKSRAETSVLIAVLSISPFEESFTQLDILTAFSYGSLPQVHPIQVVSSV